jgi:hypothetical protein
VRNLGRLERGRRIPLDPAGLHAEAEEGPEILQAFGRVERRVLPGPPELADPFDRQVPELSVPAMRAERQQLSFEELPPLLDRGRGEIPHRGVFEELLDGPR